MDWRFSGRCYALSRLPPECLKVEWLRRAAGFACVPQLPKELEVLFPQLMFELPVADGLTDDFAGGRIFAGFDRGLEGSYLLAFARPSGGRY